ncbi:MAG TPA: site-2 protease family protein [Chloroflexia bacterium]|nr:site-2 protease family protein [Chloroflexia bacterium]
MDLNWLWVVPILGVLIVVHELGHFVSALRLGIKVEEFGIGFPPRMFAIRRNGIDYSMNWLPIGGFVKITGENGDSDDPRSFGQAPAWKRIIVLAAGSFMNLVLAILIFATMAVTGTQEVDTSIAPYTGIASLLENSPAQRAGIQPGDRIVAIAGQPVRTEVDIRSLSGANAGKPTQFTVERNGREIQTTLTPNTTSPYLGVGLVPWVSPATVDDVRTAGVADAAGLRDGDIIVEVNGEAVNNSARASHLISQSTEPIRLVVERNGQQVGPLTIAPNTGSSYEFTLYRPYRTVYYGPLEAVGRALDSTWSVIAAIPAGIAQAIAGQAEGPPVTSIVGIGQLTGEVAQGAGINGLLNLTALLSISLFMINLLPLPALDGGRLLFIFIELLRGGRRIAPEKEGMVHFAGMVVLLALMALITFFDVSRLLQGVRLLP